MVCSVSCGTLFGGFTLCFWLPKAETELRQFLKNLYETVRRIYQNQFGLDIEYLEPRLKRTVYLSTYPEMYFNPNVRLYKADAQKHDLPEPIPISWESRPTLCA